MRTHHQSCTLSRVTYCSTTPRKALALALDWLTELGCVAAAIGTGWFQPSLNSKCYDVLDRRLTWGLSLGIQVCLHTRQYLRSRTYDCYLKWSPWIASGYLTHDNSGIVLYTIWKIILPIFLHIITFPHDKNFCCRNGLSTYLKREEKSYKYTFFLKHKMQYYTFNVRLFVRHDSNIKTSIVIWTIVIWYYFYIKFTF